MLSKIEIFNIISFFNDKSVISIGVIKMLFFIKAICCIGLFFLLPNFVFSQIKLQSKKLEKPLKTTKVDAYIETIQLQNGFKAILVSQQSKRKSYHGLDITLVISKGSLHEAEKEFGVAHFIEHMAFNGTKNISKNQLLSMFDEFDFKLGGNVNAFTSRNQTKYCFFTKPKFLGKTLEILFEFACNVSFDDNEIERERNIILNEKYSTDKYEDFLFQDDNILSDIKAVNYFRPTIGTEENIKAIKREDLLRYYQKHYRPENMTLIVVGYLGQKDDQMMKDYIKLIENNFNRLKAQTPNIEPEYQFKLPEFSKLNVYYKHDANAFQTKIRIAAIQKPEPQKDTHYERYLVELRNQAILFIYNQRIKDDFYGDSLPGYFVENSMYKLEDQIQVNRITATINNDNWKDALFYIENKLRQNLKTEISDLEFEFFKQTLRDKEKISKFSFRRNSARFYTDKALESVEGRYPLISDTESTELYLKALNNLKKSDVIEAYRKIWEKDQRIISIYGNLIIDGSIETIKNAYEESQKSDLNPIYVDREILLSKMPNAPHVKAKKRKGAYGKDYAIQDKMLKFNPFVNQTCLYLNISADLSTISHMYPNFFSLAEIALLQGGFEKNSYNRFKKNFAGKILEFDLNIKSDGIHFYIYLEKDDIELGMQFCRAFLMNPSFDEPASKYISKYINDVSNNFKFNPAFKFQNEVLRILTNDNGTVVIPEIKKLEAISLDDIKRLIKNIIHSGKITLYVGGNIQKDKCVNLWRNYFHDIQNDIKFKKDYIFEKKLDYSKYMAPKNICEEFITPLNRSFVFHYLPIPSDIYNYHRKKITLLAEYLDEKVKEDLIEKQGLVYMAPKVEYVSTLANPEFDFLVFYGETCTENIDLVTKCFQKNFNSSLLYLDPDVHSKFKKNYFKIRMNDFLLNHELESLFKKKPNSSSENTSKSQVTLFGQQTLKKMEWSSYILKAVKPKNTVSEKVLEIEDNK